QQPVRQRVCASSLLGPDLGSGVRIGLPAREAAITINTQSGASCGFREIWCKRVRTPVDAEIAAPEFPGGLEWLNIAFLRMQTELGRHAILVEFWDFARINSLRTSPYMKAWHERYSDLGLRVIGVHTPGYSFGREREPVERAVDRLGIEYAGALAPDYEVWQTDGNKGWPARYLFDRQGWLRFVHYGEGEYLETELAVQELLREIEPELSLPEPMGA